tara:strand:+ start:451 stop:879 length:429 start_codon:yes stop_codon:yes gene_type:complete
MENEYIEKVMKSLENDKNEEIMQLTNAKIKDQKNNILQRLQLDRTALKALHEKLREYRYVDEISDLQFGYYVRWISLKDPDNIKLTNGAHICDIKILNEGVHIVCRNGHNRFMQLNLDENLVFQKLTDQEKIILKTIDYLKK